MRIDAASALSPQAAPDEGLRRGQGTYHERRQPSIAAR